MITLLEMIWGRDFMSPGGKGNVEKLAGKVDLQGKRVLDIGCGPGGPAFILAGNYGAQVTGIDIETHLIDHAQRRAIELGLDTNTEFKCVVPGILDFPDSSFDLVVSSGAFTQIKNKRDMYEECLRVLNPGGVLSCYDWMKTEGEYSNDMLYWFKMEGLTYAMETPDGHRELLESAGFVDVELTDRSDWYRKRAREEYFQLRKELYPDMVRLLGQDDADHFIEDWRAMVTVCDKGEMLQVYSRAHKPY
jgi:ubiquinone/menaquinone biosynthesis C-methylase UbiE